MTTVDLAETSLRNLNSRLHGLQVNTNKTEWRILNPRGTHAVAAGLVVPIDVVIDGNVGYNCADMNKHATVTINAECGWGVGENIMSGMVRVKGNASQSIAASGHGGMVVEGDASSRCGMSIKGVDIVVAGSVGHMSAFMAQAGHLVVCGDAGTSLGDSIYEAVIYVRGVVESLGDDCVEKEMTAKHVDTLRGLLETAQVDADPAAFRRYGSARKLYNFQVDHAGAY